MNGFDIQSESDAQSDRQNELQLAQNAMKFKLVESVCFLREVEFYPDVCTGRLADPLADEKLKSHSFDKADQKKKSRKSRKSTVSP